MKLLAAVVVLGLLAGCNGSPSKPTHSLTPSLGPSNKAPPNPPVQRDPG
jgi:hypothetical protein